MENVFSANGAGMIGNKHLRGLYCALVLTAVRGFLMWAFAYLFQSKFMTWLFYWLGDQGGIFSLLALLVFLASIITGLTLFMVYCVLFYHHIRHVYALLIHGPPNVINFSIIFFGWSGADFLNHGCNTDGSQTKKSRASQKKERMKSDAEQERREQARREETQREQARQREQRRRYESPLPQTFAEACEVLGVAQGLPKAEYKKAYRKKALEYHTDKFQDAGEKIRMVAEEEMKRINTAWDIINRTMPD